jgi:hypothetical protein
MPPNYEQRLFKTLRRTISTKRLNVASINFGAKTKIFHPISSRITSMRVPYIFYLFQVTCLVQPFAVLTFILKPIPNLQRDYRRS